MQKKTDYQHNETRTISRFIIAILGCLSIGIAIGRAMPDDLGKLGMITGGVALFFYLFETRRDLMLRRDQNKTCRRVAEIRLLEQTLPPEQLRLKKHQSLQVFPMSETLGL